MIQTTIKILDKISYIDDSELKQLLWRVSDDFFKAGIISMEKRQVEIEANNNTLKTIRKEFDELKNDNVSTAFVNGFGNVLLVKNENFSDNKIVVWDKSDKRVFNNEYHVYVQDVLDGVEISKIQECDENYKPSW